MTFTPVHTNRNVFDLEKSIAFYKEALGYEEVRRIAPADGHFIIVFLQGPGAFQLELTWLRDMERPYDLGDNEIHLAVATEDMAAALAKHKAMGCVCYENTAMGIYFIADADGYWTEIVPAK
ncbi:MAG: VOC family protein [Oscillospiraceae bacterium]|nr:VOC family protein [Oscillospiraceae bacterium]